MEAVWQLDEDWHEVAFPDFREYSYPDVKGMPKFNFADKVIVTEFCAGQHIYRDKKTKKIIELITNIEPERVFTIIDKTRLCIGTLMIESEGQNSLMTERWFTVYVLSSGFGEKKLSLPDHMKLMEVSSESTNRR